MEKIRDRWLAAVVICSGLYLCEGVGGGVADEAAAGRGAGLADTQVSAEGAGTLILLTREPIRLAEAQLRQAAVQVWPRVTVRIVRRTAASVQGLPAERNAGEVLMVEAGSRWLLLTVEREPFASAEEIAATEDATVRRVLEQHRASLTVSGGGSNRGQPATVKDCGRLLAALLEQRLIADGVICGLVVPADETVLPWEQIQGEAVSLLRSEHPADELRTRMNAPVLNAGQHAAAVQRAAEQARGAWAEFSSAFRSRAISATAGHSVLAEFSEGTARELIWLEVRELRDGQVFGQLANRPLNLRGLREGLSVAVAESAVLDWVYVTAAGTELRGAFLSRQLAGERTAAGGDSAGKSKARQQ